MEEAFVQEVKALLEKADDTECRASLLRFMTEFSTHMSPRGLDTDVRHILVLVLLVGRMVSCHTSSLHWPSSRLPQASPVCPP